MTRTIYNIECQLCKTQYATVGMAGHLALTHKTNIDEYVNTFGEFRRNVLKRKQAQSVECLVCNDGSTHTTTGLVWHLRKAHNITKMQYVVEYILKNNIPRCECGCGTPVTIKTYAPYIIRKFISGHNSKGMNNPRYGVPLNNITLTKMRNKALQRIEYQRGYGGIPMHTPDAIAARAQTQSDTFIQRIQQEYNVTILDSIRDQHVRQYTVQCNVCTYTFAQYHNSYFLCPKCNPRFRSLKEQELVELIQSIDPNVNIQQNNRQILSGNKELDVVLPDHNIAIEFNGLYWHSELNGKDKRYHLTKTEECTKAGYQLIHIFEDEWALHKDIIKGKLSALMNKDCRTRVYARQCTIKELSFNDTKDFLNLYHLQGADSSKTRLGLFYGDMLISIMTFSKPNASRGRSIQSAADMYELSRFCTHTDYVCVGGASKLLAYFIKQCAPKHIISYADRRYSVEVKNVYEAMGFTLTKLTQPNYWYFTHKEMRRIHRFNYTKKKTVELGGSPDKTEWENMVTLGFDRIWDCGHLKYELTLN